MTCPCSSCVEMRDDAVRELREQLNAAYARIAKLEKLLAEKQATSAPVLETSSGVLHPIYTSGV